MGHQKNRSVVIDVFVDGHEVLWWSCRSGSSCHLARHWHCFKVLDSFFMFKLGCERSCETLLGYLDHFTPL